MGADYPMGARQHPLYTNQLIDLLSECNPNSIFFQIITEIILENGNHEQFTFNEQSS